MNNFALIGIAGFIAQRHLKAIKDTSNNLIASYDPFDSVGTLDNFFPSSSFFTEFELFDRFCTRQKNTENNIDFVSICTPNYLHDAHIRYGLRLGANVVCEKPLVLNPWNVDELSKVENETERKILTILQLRHHKSIIKLKQKVEEGKKSKIYNVDLTYITSRGQWYFTSWKGDPKKSGGVATNIGIHFYDMLVWVFGAVKQNIVHIISHDRVAGYLELEKARIRYYLSINSDHLPKNVINDGKTTFRSIIVDGCEFEFSDGFNDLHTESYRNIMTGNGFGLNEAKQSIQIVHDIRNAVPFGLKGDYHPFAKYPISRHPFGWK